MSEIVVDGAIAERFVRGVRGFPRQFRRFITDALRISARDVARDTRTILRSNRSGVSAPGQPPARGSGALARSIRIRRGRGGLSYSVFNQPETYYGRFLELGTDERFTTFKRGRARRGIIEPRPFLTASLERNRGEIERRIVGAINDALEAIG